MGVCVMENECVRILLIEDNPDDIVLLDEVLARANGSCPVFKFHYARCLEDGLFQLSKGDIDVVVLDLSLPDCRGLETLAHLQAKAGDVPVVVLTVLDDAEQSREMVGRGAQDYLVKSELNGYIFVRSVLHAIERSKIRIELKNMTEELIGANARLERAHVVKEVRATFSAVPGLEARRPASSTPIPNLFLAGDWTRSGWPATMEGAVRSGYIAAESITRAFGRPKTFLLPDVA